MSKFLKALRVAGDVAEIIVASSIVVEFMERFRAKKKAQVQTATESAQKCCIIYMEYLEVLFLTNSVLIAAVNSINEVAVNLAERPAIANRKSGNRNSMPA